MCDTVVATGTATRDGVTIFGKNSDREPNEAHHLQRSPAAQHPPGSRVQCTYIAIPQVEKTSAILLAKPFWIWGAEMGANEHGVVIGNEAVFTKVPYEKTGGLIGMDFLRLALERAATAAEALTVITSLLETYGQGGNCGFHKHLYYHNSFILADPHDAWVLETAGKQWAAIQVKGVRTISNGITIGNEWDMASADLVAYAVDHKWCSGRDDFHFGRCYSDFLFTRFSACHDRQCRTTDLLQAQAGRITVPDVMAALRDHGGSSQEPLQGITGAQVCMHAGFGPVRGSQTTGSMVSYLQPDNPLHFLTGTAAPCTSIFKPVWLDADLPDTGPEPGGTYQAGTLFWQHETLHRATLPDYAARLSLYQTDRDTLEAQFVAGALECQGAGVAGRTAFSAQCFAQAAAAEQEWTHRVLTQNSGNQRRWLYNHAWQGFNRQALLNTET
jgi:dipeptidase